MKETDFNVGKFFAFLFLFIIFIFMLFPLFEQGNGLKIEKEIKDLRNRVSFAYSTKSVTDITKTLKESGDYSKYREIYNQERNDIRFKESANLENGSANIVTSIVLDYRGFDTLGELIVLFISIIGLTIILSNLNFVPFNPPTFLQKTGVLFLTPFIMLTSIYISLHGHLTPGGGFPAGSIIATLSLFLMIGYKFSYKLKFLNFIESTSGFLVFFLALLGLFITGSFLGNYLPTGIVGKLFSSYLILILYSLVSIKVGAELSVAIKTLYDGENNDR